MSSRKFSCVLSVKKKNATNVYIVPTEKLLTG